AHAALPNLPTMQEHRPRTARLPDPRLGRGSGSGPTGHRPRRADTTSLCVIDGQGNAFSATPSDTLDGGPVVPGLGIIVSPRGVQSRLDPAHPSVLAPGKRPRVTPSPALVLTACPGADAMVWPLSCPGGDVIVQ